MPSQKVNRQFCAMVTEPEQADTKNLNPSLSSTTEEFWTFSSAILVPLAPVAVMPGVMLKLVCPGTDPVMR